VSRAPTGDPGVAHLWQLFVRPAYHGGGVATALLRRGLEETAARGFTRIRLFTPADQARARRFYEREGFSAPAEPVDDQALGLAVVEYWRDVR
jgi:ribosomal protein S18 acetylase RimI-like enzyme